MWLSRVVEYLFGLGLFINALLFVPQIIQLYRSKDAEGISLLTFSGFCFLQLLAILHGYFRHDHVLMIGYFFSIVTCGTVTILIFIYKKSPQISDEKIKV